MTLLLLSFIAGALTVTAPCVLIFLPVILGGSLVDLKSASADIGGWRRRRPIIITASLALSIILFTLILKATTALLDVPQLVWQLLSGLIVILLGVHYLGVPIWEKFTSWLRLPQLANRKLADTSKVSGYWGAILTGAALGPVFASCSPTFAFIVAAVLPADFILGLIYLAVYATGLSATLLIIAFAGQSIVTRLSRVNNSQGTLARIIGVLFIIVGIMVITGLDKQVQTFVLEQGWYDGITSLENSMNH